MRPLRLSARFAAAAAAVAHPMRLTAGGAAAPEQSDAGTCLALLLPGASGETPGCTALDVVEEHGGRALWEAKGLVKGDALTSAGVDAAVRLVVTALFGARPTASPVERPG